MSEIHSKFGERIRTVRKKAGLSQREFCSLFDIPQPTLSAYETDRMQPTIATLINIATRFNVSIDWFCGFEKTISEIEKNAPSVSTLGEAISAVYDLAKIEGLKIEIAVNIHG